MNERWVAEQSQPENKPSRLKSVRNILETAVIMGAVYFGGNFVIDQVGLFDDDEEASSSRNIHDFDCDLSKIENLIDDGKGYDANRIGLKLSSDILPGDLVDIFEEEQICVLPGLLLRPNSFGVQVNKSERDEVIDRFEEEMGESVEEVRKVPITKFE